MFADFVLEERGYQFRRIYEGHFLKDWLGERLARLGVHTFADLRYDDPERPPDPQRGDRLVVMACDISQGRLRRLPWEYYDYGLPGAGQPANMARRLRQKAPRRPGSGPGVTGGRGDAFDHCDASRSAWRRMG